VPSRLGIAVPKPEPKPKENVVRFPAPARVKNPAAVALGKLGGSKGGKIRAAKLSEERRREIAQQGAKARHRSGLESETMAGFSAFGPQKVIAGHGEWWPANPYLQAGYGLLHFAESFWTSIRREPLLSESL
jgi:hypothetical protein